MDSDYGALAAKVEEHGERIASLEYDRDMTKREYAAILHSVNELGAIIQAVATSQRELLGKLTATARVAQRADERAETATTFAARASGTNEIVNDMATLELERRKDSLFARKQTRDQAWAIVGKVLVPFLVAVVGALGAYIARLLGAF